MKIDSYKDYYLFLENFIKTQKLGQICEGLEGEDEIRGITSECINIYLRSIIKIENATGISKWTNSGRNHATHLYINGEMLCGKQFFSQERTPFDLKRVSCKKCLSEYKKSVSTKSI